MAIDEDTVSRIEALRRLRSCLNDMEGSQVTLLGDVMLDRYHHGYANNLNSIAPVPVLKIFQTTFSPGFGCDYIPCSVRVVGTRHTSYHYAAIFTCVRLKRRGHM